MKRLDRYVIRELFVPFLIGTLAVVLMFDINQLMAMTKEWNLSAVPKLAVAQFILYKTPFYLNMTLPVGMSLAASLAMSRLARESELTAMRGAGTRVFRVICPVAFVGLLVSIGGFFLNEKVMPLSEKRATNLQQEIGVLANAPDFAENVYIRLQQYQVSVRRVQRIGPDKVMLEDVLLFSRPSLDQIQVMLGDTGYYDHGQWYMQDARVWVFGKDDQVLTFKPHQRVNFNEKIAVNDIIMPPQPEEETAGQLRDEIALNKLHHIPTQQLEINYQVRFSVPAACFIFAFVAPALAIMFARSGFAGVLLSIFIVFLYFNVYVTTTQILGKDPAMPPIVAAWAPDVLFLILGLIAIRRLE